MATVTLNTDAWIESSSPIAVLATDESTFTIHSPISVSLSTDFWDFSYHVPVVIDIQSDWFAVSEIGDRITQISVPIIAGDEYKLQFQATIPSDQLLRAYQGSQMILAAPSSGSLHTYSKTFTADSTGQSISFEPLGSGRGPVTLDNISLKDILHHSIDDDRPVKEFLIGTTDDGREIFFRADTTNIQLMDQFELFANPIAIVTKGQRGAMMRCFVSLDNEEFYELQGTIKKGVTILKVHSLASKIDPAMARKIKISWRDSSKQLCRITQGAIIFLPTTADEVE